MPFFPARASIALASIALGACLEGTVVPTPDAAPSGTIDVLPGTREPLEDGGPETQQPFSSGSGDGGFLEPPPFTPETPEQGVIGVMVPVLSPKRTDGGVGSSPNNDGGVGSSPIDDGGVVTPPPTPGPVDSGVVTPPPTPGPVDSGVVAPPPTPGPVDSGVVAPPPTPGPVDSGVVTPPPTPGPVDSGVVTPPPTPGPVDSGVVAPPADSGVVTPPKSRALHGVYHWDAPRGPAEVDAFASWSGQQVEVASAYAPRTSWDELHDLGWQMPAWGAWVKAQPGRRLVYTLPMMIEEGDSLADCAAGAYDSHFAAVGAQLVDAGLGNSFIRLGWEWDGFWMPWSSLGHESEFVGCYRHAATAMRKARPNGALQFEWSASGDIYQRTAAQISGSYPGDEFVDVFGINAYDVSWVPNTYPLPADCDDACKSSRRLAAYKGQLLRGLTYMSDLARQKGKPMAISEWGLWARIDGHGGGDNPDHIERIHAFVNDPNNHVLYQVYFDIPWDEGDHQISPLDGRTTQFPLGAARYKQLFGTE